MVQRIQKKGLERRNNNRHDLEGRVIEDYEGRNCLIISSLPEQYGLFPVVAAYNLCGTMLVQVMYIDKKTPTWSGVVLDEEGKALKKVIITRYL